MTCVAVVEAPVVPSPASGCDAVAERPDFAKPGAPDFEWRVRPYAVNPGSFFAASTFFSTTYFGNPSRP